MARIPFCFLVSVGLCLSPLRAAAQQPADDDLLAPVGGETAPAPDETTAPPEEVKAAPEVAPKSVERKDAAAVVPPVALEADRIKAVPRKPVLKNGRFEVFGAASFSTNDAFYQHLAFDAALVFYPHDAFGIGFGADYLYARPKTSNVDVVRQSLTSVPAIFELPRLFAHLDLYWIPVYGKVSLFESGIIHFDFYGSAGAGLVTAFGKRRPVEVNAGVGQRFYLGDWLALRFEVRDHFFVDTFEVSGMPDPTRSDLQSYLLFMAGVSFFIPPTFEYTYR
ncbi:MAG: outer membrane beta-barrel domain-containing protein [Deltaproteobacteria bacterium]|nr:outer membrane beta-barrel domain-containing protein [Deltaproteobacteria bacterium]